MSLKENFKEQYAESKRIINEAQRNGQLVLFVGAGASIPSGMPSWGEAIRVIAQHLGIKDVSPDDFLRIPQYYYNAREKKEYNQLMQEIFLYRKFLPTSAVHDMIIEFNTQTIVTTNYDHLIEQAAENNSEMIRVISKDSDLPYRKGGRELIKMHGDFENDNFVLREEDYLAYSRNFKLIENYVKSIIGTKVVLFIGYSVNDPDVKHIFSWAKDILHGDFQPAYLISTDDDYNLNVDTYYKKLGINVLYSPVHLSTDNENLGKAARLERMLSWLLDRKGSRSKLEELYDKIKIFREFDYSYESRIESAFRRLGYRYDCGYLALELFPNHHTYIKDYEALNHILFAIAYARYKQNPVDIYVKTSGDEKIQYEIEEGYKASIDEEEFVAGLLDVLNKSAIRGLIVFIPIDDKHTLLDNEIAFMRTHHRVLVDFDDAVLTPEWLEYIYRFNDSELRNLSEKNNSKLNESTPDLYMEQASIHSYFAEYLATYNCLRTAASLYYKRGSVVKYFIAETDRYYIGKIIKDNGTLLGLNQDDILEVSKEIESISLEMTYWSLPDLGTGMSILKDICSFDISFQLFQNAYKIAEKVKDQANTKYNMFTGLPAFSTMRRDIMDFQKFEFHNYIILDRYGENNIIYKLYFKSMLASALSPDLGNSEGGENASNIHAECITEFELFVAIKYISYHDLEKMLKDVKRIPADESGIRYLKDVVKCIGKPHTEWIVAHDLPFWKTVLLMGLIDVDEPLFNITMKKICECSSGVDFIDYRNAVIKLVDNVESLNLISDNNVTDIRNYLINVLNYLATNGRRETRKLLSMVQLLAHICYEHNNPFDDIEIIKALFSDQSNFLCIELYPVLGENAKKTIEEKYINWTPMDNADGYIEYCIAAGNDIVEVNADIEIKIFEYIRNEKQKNDSKKVETDQDNRLVISFGLVEPDYIRLSGMLCDLYLRKHIFNNDLLIETVKYVGDSFSVWLIDLDSFDYNEFDVEWLNRCYPPLLQDIGKNEIAKEGICRKISETYLQGKADKKLMERYFKYIVNP